MTVFPNKAEVERDKTVNAIRKAALKKLGAEREKRFTWGMFVKAMAGAETAAAYNAVKKPRMAISNPIQPE